MKTEDEKRRPWSISESGGQVGGVLWIVMTKNGVQADICNQNIIANFVPDGAQ